MNNNSILKVLIGIVLVALGAVLGYGIGTKLSSKTNITTDTSIKKENSSVVTSDDKYDSFSKQLISNLKKFDENNYPSLIASSMMVPDDYQVYQKPNGELYIRYRNNELNAKYGTQLISDQVLSFYILPFGQGGYNILYFINFDGTVGMADVEFINNNGIEVTKKLENYKNIVSITNGVFGDGHVGANSPIFIDIDGNIYSSNLK